MSRYISFVFHQKSAKQEIKSQNILQEEYEDYKYEEKDNSNDSDYSD